MEIFCEFELKYEGFIFAIWACISIITVVSHMLETKEIQLQSNKGLSLIDKN